MELSVAFFFTTRYNRLIFTNKRNIMSSIVVNGQTVELPLPTYTEMLDVFEHDENMTAGDFSWWVQEVEAIMESEEYILATVSIEPAPINNPFGKLKELMQ
jgi:hypothetical protein